MTKIKWFDAVRAFGLFLVLGYHLFFRLLPGGFLGVDIFFTFSGFLITALFIEEVRSKGDFSLFKYYQRRFRRIMVPLFYSIVFTLPFALLISPDFTVGISKHVASALSYTINWYNLKTGASYEARLLPQMYTHTWSLAILMQIYVVWGLVCALVSAVSKVVCKKYSSRRQTFIRIVILVLSGGITAASFLYMQSLPDTVNDLNEIYFNTFARAFPFFAGSFAATVWGLQPKQDRTLKKHIFSKRPKLIATALIFVIVLTVAVIVLFLSQHEFGDLFIYRIGFPLTSVLAVVLIYCTHGLHILTPPKKNEPRILTAAAGMSFDIYLFHWPFYVVLSSLIMNNTTASLVTLAAALVFSVITVYGAKYLTGSKSISGSAFVSGRAKRRRIVVTVISVITAGAVAAGIFVILKAPAITSIEKDFVAGYISGDINDIESLRSGIAAVNDSPILHIYESKNLQMNTLQEETLSSDRLTQPVQPPPAPVPLPSTESTAEPTQDPTSGPTTEPQIPPSTSPSPSPSSSSSPSPPPSSSPSPVSLPESEDRPPGIPAGVTVIGDSVPLGARTTVIKRIADCDFDAETNRTVNQGRAFMKELQDKRELREYVVIALGTNGSYDYADQFAKIINDLNPGHRLIFVTPFDGRDNNNSKLTENTAEWMRSLPDQYDFITIADWNTTVSTQVDLLAGDKVHMGYAPSMELYSDVISSAISEASQKPAKSQ